MDLTAFFKKIRIGIFLSFAATFVYALSSVFSASVVSQIGPSNLMSVRYVMQGLLTSPFLLANTESIVKTSKKEILFIILSGLTIGTAALCGYASFQYIPIVDATVLFNCQPVVVFIISSLWLKEKIGFYDVGMLILVLIGVILTCQPTAIFGYKNPEDYNGLSLSWVGYVYASTTTLGVGISTCFIKRAQNAGAPTILIFQAITALSLGLLVGGVIGDQSDPSTNAEWAYMFGTAIASSLARALLTCALMYEDSSFISVISTIEILFSIIFQIIFFGIIPNWVSILGAFLLALGVIGIKLKTNFYNKFFRKSEEQKSLL